mgnify:CR=1 FL=1
MVVIPCEERGVSGRMVVIPCEARGINCEARGITAPGALPYGPPQADCGADHQP